MSILRRPPPVRAPAMPPRIACPRCATVNCTRHHAASLTTSAIPHHWKGARP